MFQFPNGSSWCPTMTPRCAHPTTWKWWALGVYLHSHLQKKFTLFFSPLSKTCRATYQYLDYLPPLVFILCARTWRNCIHFWIFALLKEDQQDHCQRMAILQSNNYWQHMLDSLSSCTWPKWWLEAELQHPGHFCCMLQIWIWPLWWLAAPQHLGHLCCIYQMRTSMFLLWWVADHKVNNKKKIKIRPHSNSHEFKAHWISTDDKYLS